MSAASIGEHFRTLFFQSYQERELARKLKSYILDKAKFAGIRQQLAEVNWIRLFAGSGVAAGGKEYVNREQCVWSGRDISLG